LAYPVWRLHGDVRQDGKPVGEGLRNYQLFERKERQ
jgi:hypothetical protein